MQRLISLFPRGGPGIGLILLRLAVGFGLATHDPTALPDEQIGVAYFATGVIALALLAGLFTPWLAMVCCIVAVVDLCCAEFGMDTLSALAFGLCAAALMLIGPGAYSADALFFGRRVVKIPD